MYIRRYVLSIQYAHILYIQTYCVYVLCLYVYIYACANVRPYIIYTRYTCTCIFTCIYGFSNRFHADFGCFTLQKNTAMAVSIYICTCIYIYIYAEYYYLYIYMYVYIHMRVCISSHLSKYKRMNMHIFVM